MKVKSQQAGDSDEVKHISKVVLCVRYAGQTLLSPLCIKAVFLQMPENALNPLVERIVSAVG